MTNSRRRSADALVIDTRPAEEFAKGHVAGTLNIPLGGSFVTWAGWLIPSDQDFYVVTDRIDDVRRALGVDRARSHRRGVSAGGRGRQRTGAAGVRGRIEDSGCRRTTWSSSTFATTANGKRDTSPTRFTSRSASSRSASTNSPRATTSSCIARVAAGRRSLRHCSRRWAARTSRTSQADTRAW